MDLAHYRGGMERCVRCGEELGVGRFCLNCGHPKGEPAPDSPAEEVPAPIAPQTRRPGSIRRARTAVPMQAAEPTPVPPLTADERASEDRAQPDDPPSEQPAWDPRQDLLPYEEVGDVDRDAPLKGKAWIVWVLAAVLVVGLAFALLRAFGVDDGAAADPNTSSPTSEQGVASGSSETDAPQKGVGKRINLARTARIAVPGTAPSTTDFDGTTAVYEARQMRDGKPSTAWRVAGDATGRTVTVTMPRPAVVQRVGLINGYAKKVAGVDWYPNNRRILSVTWGFDDGTTIDQTFQERPGRQKIKVPFVTTKKVTISITSVTRPGSGSLGRDYTAISEISIIGRRAG